jgi:hypothetical protein
LNDPYWTYKFAKDIPEANIQELQKGALSFPGYSYKFARDIPGADIELLLEGVKKDSYYLKMYIKDILKITQEEYEEKYKKHFM